MSDGSSKYSVTQYTTNFSHSRIIMEICRTIHALLLLLFGLEMPRLL